MRSLHALKMMNKKIFTWLAVLLLAEASISAVPGATVLWSSPQSISGDADVRTTGGVILAANIGSATATTVNGVTFATQIFNLLGGHNAGTTGSTQLNGFQLRAVPEPSQALLAARGVVSIGLRRRRSATRCQAAS